MIHAAHSSLFHWGRGGGLVELCSGEWQVSRVYSVLGRGEPAIYHPQRCLNICEENGSTGFDHAITHESLARAHVVSGISRPPAACAACARPGKRHRRRRGQARLRRRHGDPPVRAALVSRLSARPSRRSRYQPLPSRLFCVRGRRRDGLAPMGVVAPGMAGRRLSQCDGIRVEAEFVDVHGCVLALRLADRIPGIEDRGKDARMADAQRPSGLWGACARQPSPTADRDDPPSGASHRFGRVITPSSARTMQHTTTPT
jgi:hypothetical protein